MTMAFLSDYKAEEIIKVKKQISGFGLLAHDVLGDAPDVDNPDLSKFEKDHIGLKIECFGHGWLLHHLHEKYGEDESFAMFIKNNLGEIYTKINSERFKDFLKGE